MDYRDDFYSAMGRDYGVQSEYLAHSNFGYVKREWINGKWRYWYPQDLKRAASGLANRARTAAGNAMTSATRAGVNARRMAGQAANRARTAAGNAVNRASHKIGIGYKMDEKRHQQILNSQTSNHKKLTGNLSDAEKALKKKQMTGGSSGVSKGDTDRVRRAKNAVGKSTSAINKSRAAVANDRAGYQNSLMGKAERKLKQAKQSSAYKSAAAYKERVDKKGVGIIGKDAAKALRDAQKKANKFRGQLEGKKAQMRVKKEINDVKNYWKDQANKHRSAQQAEMERRKKARQKAAKNARKASNAASRYAGRVQGFFGG